MNCVGVGVGVSDVVLCVVLCCIDVSSCVVVSGFLLCAMLLLLFGLCCLGAVLSWCCVVACLVLVRCV